MSYNVDLTLEIRASSKKLLVGGGGAIGGKFGTDISLQRICDQIFIPGSTIKGVLRTSLIRISHLLGERCCGTVLPGKLMGRDGLDINLLGGPDKFSKIFVSPVFLNGGTPVSVLAHNKIDVRTGIVEEGAFFLAEYLPIGLRFQVRIYGNNLSLREARALMVSIAELNYERVGRAGMAEVKILREKSKIPRDLMADPVIKEVLEALSI